MISEEKADEVAIEMLKLTVGMSAEDVVRVLGRLLYHIGWLLSGGPA